MAQVTMKNNVLRSEVVSGEATGKEIFGHAIAGVGQNFIFAFWSGYMMMFYTDVFELAPAFVGMLFFGARVWDAVNDPMMGIVADKTRTRWGRFRPWLLFMPIPIGICLILNFTVPNLSGTAAMIYATVTYILMSMAFTAIDIPYWSMPSAMTTDPVKRTKIFSYSNLSTTMASTIAGMMIVPLLNTIGGGDMKKGFMGTAMVMAAIGVTLYLVGFKLVREHVEASSEKFNYKKAGMALGQNKPLLIVLVSAVALNLGLIIKMSLQLYYVQYNLGTLDLVPMFSMIALPGTIMGSLLAPKISTKFGKKKTLIGSSLGLLLAGLAFMITPYSQVLLIMVLSAVQVTFIGLAMVVVSSMIADTIEYAEWKTGQRNEGVISSTRTFTTKLAMALAGLIAGGILTMSGYVPNAEQAQSTLTVFHLVASVLPGIVAVIACIPMKWYDLTEERHAEIIKEIEVRKANR